MFALKRVYEAPTQDDGYRVLVERLWPRGLRKDAARLDIWMKDVAPSPTLRADFKSGKLDWPQFSARYRTELTRSPAAELVAALRDRGGHGKVTLLYAKADPIENSASILHDVLLERR